MPSGGTLQVLAGEVVIEEADVESSWTYGLNAGRYVRIQITDDGTGMDKATQARALEPFFTTKPRGVGTGLGLSTTHGTVVAVGGSLQIRSSLGEGTQVTILLPMAEAEQAVAGSGTTGASQAEDEADNGGYRIAIVEDREILAESLVAMLRRLGHIPTAYYSAEAMAAAEGIEDFELLITDMELPGMSGLELSRQLQSSYPDLASDLNVGARGARTYRGRHNRISCQTVYSPAVGSSD